MPDGGWATASPAPCCSGSASALVLLGLLRLIQAEWDRAASGSLSWLPYLIVLVVCVLLIVLTVSRINKPSLNKEVE